MPPHPWLSYPILNANLKLSLCLLQMSPRVFSIVILGAGFPPSPSPSQKHSLKRFYLRFSEFCSNRCSLSPACDSLVATNKSFPTFVLQFPYQSPCIFFLLSETGSHYATMAGLLLSMYIKGASNSQTSACLCLSGAESIGNHHFVWQDPFLSSSSPPSFSSL